jgi:uridine kinase
VVEGILALHHPQIRAVASLRVFVDTPEGKRLDCRIERDIRERGRTRESVLRQWQDTVQPMHIEFCEPSKAYADLLVGREELDSTVGVIKSRLGVSS